MFGFCDLEDPETGEEYMLRRGECVNVLPGFFKKVWTYNSTIHAHYVDQSMIIVLGWQCTKLFFS